MTAQVGDTTNGWPLGLENMNMRLIVVDSIQRAAAESYPFHSSSFSSLTSSGLNTESTRSFFQEKSVPLGRLIRIRPGDGGDLYFTNSIRFGDRRPINSRSVPMNTFKKQKAARFGRICIPLLQNVCIKFISNKNASRC